MKKLVYTAVLFALLAPLAAWSHPSIDIVASNWKFTPGTITVHLNEPATLRLTSSGGVHGIASSELGIPKTTIVPNSYVTVTFTPKKLGTYEIHCAIICGAGHSDMEIIVKVVQ
jgi:cytochrome c oxidase subunit 2